MRGALGWIERYRRFWESSSALAIYLEGPSSSESSWPASSPPAPQPASQTAPNPTLEVRRTIRACGSRSSTRDATGSADVGTRPRRSRSTAPTSTFTPAGAGACRCASRTAGNVVGGVYRDRSAARNLYSWAWEGGTFANLIVSVEFIDRGDETEVVLQQIGCRPATRSRSTNTADACFDRLEEMFALTAASPSRLEVRRTIRAPQQRVDAWTRRKRSSRHAAIRRRCWKRAPISASAARIGASAQPARRRSLRAASIVRSIRRLAWHLS